MLDKIYILIGGKKNFESETCLGVFSVEEDAERHWKTYFNGSDYRIEVVKLADFEAWLKKNDGKIKFD